MQSYDSHNGHCNNTDDDLIDVGNGQMEHQDLVAWAKCCLRCAERSAKAAEAKIVEIKQRRHQWMFADAGQNLVGTKIAQCMGFKDQVNTLIVMNPFRWSSSLNFDQYIAELENAEQRPIGAKIEGANLDKVHPFLNPSAAIRDAMESFTSSCEQRQHAYRRVCLAHIDLVAAFVLPFVGANNISKKASRRPQSRTRDLDEQIQYLDLVAQSMAKISGSSFSKECEEVSFQSNPNHTSGKSEASKSIPSFDFAR